jgi:hypothetical protein
VRTRDERNKLCYYKNTKKHIYYFLNVFKYNVGSEVLTAVVMKSIIFWDVTPCSLLSCNRRFGGNLLVLTEIISSALKMEAICSSGTSVETQRTTWRDIPEDDTLKKFHYPALVYCPPATGLCAVPFTRWQLLDCEVVGERQWAVKTKMFEFTGIVSCCPTGLSSYWLMCLHRDSNWHPVTGHLNWHATWHRANGPLVNVNCTWIL